MLKETEDIDMEKNTHNSPKTEKGIAYCGLAALSFAVIAVARREHPTMVTLTLLTIACVIPFLVLFAGTIGIFIVVLYFIFSLFRR